MAIWLLFMLAVMSGTDLLLKRAPKAHSYMSEALIYCAFLLFVNTQVFENNNLFKTALTSFNTAVCNLFTSSNHFILSLDIMFLFSSGMLILYNALKLEGSYPEKQ